MIGHIGLTVPNLVAAKGYYDSLMPLVGFEPFIANADEFAYRPAAGKRGTYIFFYPSAAGYQADSAGLQHLAFMVPTRSAVHAVFDHVTSVGDTVVLEPQDFPQYPPPYYAMFWLDPHGFKLEAVCHHDRD
jgi:catechol 2,3-dioxygenase-like lactoylglutathione lyase family enzyme